MKRPYQHCVWWFGFVWPSAFSYSNWVSVFLCSRECISVVNPAPFFQSCVYDMCQFNGQQHVLCDQLQAYTDACQSAGAKVHQWRTPYFCRKSSLFEFDKHFSKEDHCFLCFWFGHRTSWLQNISTVIRCIAMKFATDIHVPNNNFGDSQSRVFTGSMEKFNWSHFQVKYRKEKNNICFQTIAPVLFFRIVFVQCKLDCLSEVNDAHLHPVLSTLVTIDTVNHFHPT